MQTPPVSGQSIENQKATPAPAQNKTISTTESRVSSAVLKIFVVLAILLAPFTLGSSLLLAGLAFVIYASCCYEKTTTQTLDSVGRSYFRSLEKRKELADAGDMEAQFNLACRYGSGLEKNDELAFKYFKMAAGHPQSKTRHYAILAACYEKGRGTVQDEDLAFKYYKMAADNDEYWPNFCFQVAVRYETGKGTEKDEAQALAYYIKAATPFQRTLGAHHADSSKGNIKAQMKVAELYENGSSLVEQSSEEAFKYYKMAADNGGWSKDSEELALHMKAQSKIGILSP